MAHGENIGIIQRIHLMLDRAAAAEVAHGIKETLEKGTNADKPVHEMGRIGKAFETLKEHAMEIGTAIAAAFALEKLFEFGKESAHAALESRKEWNLLGNALENVGTDLGTVREELEKHMDTFIKAGTAGEDDYVRVLRSLVQLSGDYEKSLGNVQVVVDLAAAKQIDLQTAALLVGKAMNGQGAMLKRYGIIVKDGADAVEELNKRFHGAAESIDPAIRAQRRLAEEWEHFHRAVGEAILSAGGGATFMDTLLGVIRALTTAVSENKEGFAALASGMLWLVRVAGAATLGLFSGVTQILALVVTGYRALVESLQYSAQAFGISTPGIDKHIESLKALEAQMKSAAVASDKMAHAIMGQGEKPPAPVEARPDTPIGGAVRKSGKDKTGPEEDPEEKRIKLLAAAAQGESTRKEALAELAAMEKKFTDQLAAGNKTFEERTALEQKLKEVRDAMKAPEPGEDPEAKRIELLSAAAEGESTRKEALVELAALEKKLTDELAAGNKTFEERVALEKKLADVREAMKAANPGEILKQGFDEAISAMMDSGASMSDVLKKLAGDAAIVQAAMMMMGKGSAQGVLKELAALAKGKVMQNVASAVEELAQAAADAAHLNFAGAGAHLKAAAGFGFAAAKWGLLARGAGSMISSGGAGAGGVTSGGNTAGQGTATDAQPVGAEVHIHLNPYDPKSPTWQALWQDTQQEVRERWGGEAVLHVEGA
jgi:DNA-binding FrmR family transcriptional regulator